MEDSVNMAELKKLIREIASRNGRSIDDCLDHGWMNAFDQTDEQSVIRTLASYVNTQTPAEVAHVLARRLQMLTGQIYENAVAEILGNVNCRGMADSRSSSDSSSSSSDSSSSDEDDESTDEYSNPDTDPIRSPDSSSDSSWIDELLHVLAEV